MGDGLLETHRTTEAVDDGELIDEGESRARGELARPRDVALADPLPAPVELGRGLRRDRVRLVEPGASRDGAPLALLRPMARRPAAAHRVHRRGSVLSRPRVLADGAFAGAPKLPKTSGIVQPPIHGSAALQVYRLASDRERGVAFLEELLPKLAAGTRTCTASARGAMAVSSRSGTRGSRAWTTPRSGTRRSSGWHSTPTSSRSTNAWTSSSPTPPSGHPTGSTTATCTSSTCSAGSRTTPHGSGTSCRSRSSRFSSTPARPVEPGSGRDRAHRRRRSGALRELGREHCRGLEETLWDEEHAVYVDYDVRDGRAGRRANRRRVSRRSTPGFPRLLEPRRWSSAGGLAGRDGRGRLGDHEPGSPRPGLPACPLLARPDLAHPELGAPARARSLRIPAARRRRSPRDHRACANAGSASITAR